MKRLPWQAANEGKILVVADVAELAHKPAPARSPAGDHPITATLKGRIEALQAEQNTSPERDGGP